MWLAGVPPGTASEGNRRLRSTRPWAGKGIWMAAMKPRTGDGPLEVTKEGRGIVMRVPLEGGGRLVVELTPDEARSLSEALTSAVG
jgi:hypothetical protein